MRGIVPVLVAAWLALQPGVLRGALTSSSLAPLAEVSAEIAPVPPSLHEGWPIALVHYDLLGSTGSRDTDEEARRALAEAAGIDAGTPFSRRLADAALARILQLDAVEAADWAIYPARFEGQVVLVFKVALGERAVPAGATID